MTPAERKSLAEQLAGNPLLDEILSGIERDAIETLIIEKTEQGRIEAQWRIRSVRSFRAELSVMLNTRAPKVAPA